MPRELHESAAKLREKKKKKKKLQKRSLLSQKLVRKHPSITKFRQLQKSLKAWLLLRDLFHLFIFLFFYSSLPSLKERKNKKKLLVRAAVLTSCVLCRGYPGKYVRGISTAGSSEPRAIPVK